MSKAKLWY